MKCGADIHVHRCFCYVFLCLLYFSCFCWAGCVFVFSFCLRVVSFSLPQSLLQTPIKLRFIFPSGCIFPTMVISDFSSSDHNLNLFNIFYDETTLKLMTFPPVPQLHFVPISQCQHVVMQCLYLLAASLIIYEKCKNCTNRACDADLEQVTSWVKRVNGIKEQLY